ncbi:GNAT family N-acetyltransferase [Microbacterium binotii]|uniref:GNAT family N-acetyltransferase n=1 Tax=Microbacterium binotii TaxID=462710 RepID=UPI001F3C5987|nr:GNAT family N-acetyltransferase [Microbacterium binotii]UIN32313.1 N-acetyltransferase family protein [Microbacterium binotii]
MIGIRPMQPADWPAVEAIYRAGLATGNASFDAEPPTWEAFDDGKLKVGRLVAVDPEGVVTGWVAASAVSHREVYRGVVEHSVYVATDVRGGGVGRALLSALLDAMDDAGMWTVQSSIFVENSASLALHERAGFRRVGRRERIALMSYGPWAGQWRDTVLVERRRRD